MKITTPAQLPIGAQTLLAWMEFKGGDFGYDDLLEFRNAALVISSVERDSKPDPDPYSEPMGTVWIHGWAEQSLTHDLVHLARAGLVTIDGGYRVVSHDRPDDATASEREPG